MPAASVQQPLAPRGRGVGLRCGCRASAAKFHFVAHSPVAPAHGPPPRGAGHRGARPSVQCEGLGECSWAEGPVQRDFHCECAGVADPQSARIPILCFRESSASHKRKVWTRVNPTNDNCEHVMTTSFILL